jgi:hypothetical protein
LPGGGERFSGMLFLPYQHHIVIHETRLAG